MTEMLFVLAIVAAGFGLWLRGRRGKRRGGRRGKRASDGRRAEQALLHMALGDTAQVERLIAAERRRNPGGNRAKWAIAAHRRWLADLR